MNVFVKSIAIESLRGSYKSYKVVPIVVQIGLLVEETDNNFR